jgi:hypothetical protein
VLLFLVKRRRVWGSVVDRFPFAEGLGVKRERSEEDLLFPGLRIPIRRGGRLFASVISFVAHSGVAVP